MKYFLVVLFSFAAFCQICIGGGVVSDSSSQDDGPDNELKELKKNVSSLWTYVDAVRQKLEHDLHQLHQSQIEVASKFKSILGIELEQDLGHLHHMEQGQQQHLHHDDHDSHEHHDHHDSHNHHDHHDSHEHHDHHDSHEHHDHHDSHEHNHDHHNEHHNETHTGENHDEGIHHGDHHDHQTQGKGSHEHDHLGNEHHDHHDSHEHHNHHDSHEHHDHPDSHEHHHDHHGHQQGHDAAHPSHDHQTEGKGSHEHDHLGHHDHHDSHEHHDHHGHKHNQHDHEHHSNEHDHHGHEHGHNESTGSPKPDSHQQVHSNDDGHHTHEHKDHIEGDHDHHSTGHTSNETTHTTEGHHHHHHHNYQSHHHHYPSHHHHTHRFPHSNSSEFDFAVCIIEPNTAIPLETQQNVTGKISLYQKKNDTVLHIHINVKGFDVGGEPVNHVHGFHVHENGDLSHSCQSTGPHFNPTGAEHGSPSSAVRHVGDLGNIVCNQYGVINVHLTDKIASLHGEHSIIGKSLVIHKNVDDFGVNKDNPESVASGNAGLRIACGIIQRVDRLSIGGTQHHSHGHHHH